MSDTETDSVSSGSLVEGAVGGEVTPPQCPPSEKTDSLTGSVIDRLLQKQKTERMFELRNLQHGERPVTGQGNRKAVEEFFNRSQETPTTNGDPNIEQHRPEAVIVEVQGLIESRRVSSVLESLNFRRQLENTVRRSLGTIRTSTLPSSSVPPPPVSETPYPRATGVRRFLSPLEQAERENSPHSGNSNISSLLNDDELTRARLDDRDLDIAVPNISTTEPVSPAVAWLQQQPLQQISENDQRQMISWENIEQAQRENIIMDVSELLHRQLVTSSLNNSFRNSLERLMQNRVQSSGTDGARVLDYIQSIPQSQPHVRNDFSHLGLQGAMQDNLDSISVISATAAVHVPQSQSNTTVNREIQSLKSQIVELKNMMKLSFDLQMDLQRSIRQEVSAALSQATGGATAAIPAPTPPVNDGQCLICLDRQTDTVLYKCGHMCVCHCCGLRLQEQGLHCPICRAPIRDIIRAYRSNNS